MSNIPEKIMAYPKLTKRFRMILKRNKTLKQQVSNMINNLSILQ